MLGKLPASFPTLSGSRPPREELENLIKLLRFQAPFLRRVQIWEKADGLRSRFPWCAGVSVEVIAKQFQLRNHVRRNDPIKSSSRQQPHRGYDSSIG